MGLYRHRPPVAQTAPTRLNPFVTHPVRPDLWRFWPVCGSKGCRKLAVVALVWCSSDFAPVLQPWTEAMFVVPTPWKQERKRIDKPRRPAISSNHPVRNLLVGRYGECWFIIGEIP